MIEYSVTPPVQPATQVTQLPPANQYTANSPLWWVTELERELELRLPLIWLYEDAYEGRHRLSFMTSKYRKSFGQMLAAVSDNWLPMIVNASVERLKPQGFLFGQGEARKASTDAWNMWQYNHLDADASLAFTEAVKHGEAYMLVWPQETDGVFGRYFSRQSATVPKITVEHPSQMIVQRAGGDRRERAAALKRWQEADGTHMATLYLPNEIYYFTRPKGKGEWIERDPGSAKHNLGVVPVVPLVNNPHMLPCRPPLSLTVAPHNCNPAATVGLGRSDMADAISTVYEINKYLCDMMVASEVAAFRQRWAAGLEVPVDEETGQPKEPFDAAVDRLWVAAGEKGKDVKFGEFTESDLNNYVTAIEQRVGSLSSRTQTPPTYFPGPGLSNISDRALKTTETRFASKVSGKQTSFGEGLEESERIGFKIMGDPNAEDYSAETIWAPAESRTEAEVADSLVKKMAIGVPKEQLWADYGYSPQQIQQFKTMLIEQALMEEELGVKVPPPPAPEPEPAA